MGVRMKLLLILVTVNICDGARILGVFPVASISHQVVYRAVCMELAKRGHELVILTPDPALPKDRPKDNITEIDVHDFSYYQWNKDLKEVLQTVNGDLDAYTFWDTVFKSIYKTFEMQLDTPEMKAILDNQDEKFDLILYESLIRLPLLLSHRFKAPMIGISSLSGLIENFEAMGSPTHPLLYPDVCRKKLYNLTTWDRVREVWQVLALRYLSWTYRNEENRIVRKYAGEDAPDIKELEKNVDMLFINVNPIWDGIRPLTPNVIYIGRMHLKEPKPLPKELKAWLDKSKRGVVYMSLGTNVKSSNLSNSTRTAFLEAFKLLPYDVLWKWETDELQGKPDNVRIAKWLPQSDLLRHRNIKAFVMQGGLQSIDEAIEANVPLVGIPFFGDQMMNVQKIVKHGIGVEVLLETLTEQQLSNSILEVINTPKYRESIRRLRVLLKDEPMSSAERAGWWAEYVIRHGGAQHLKGPAAHAALADYFMIDVLAIFGAAILLSVTSVVFVVTVIVKTLKATLFGHIKMKTM